MSLNFSVTYLALWVIVLGQGLLLVALLHQLAKLRQLAELGSFAGRVRLPIGSTAPDIAKDANSNPVSIADLGELGGIVLFLSVGCPSCEDLVESMKEPKGGDLPPLIAICHGSQRTCGKFLHSLGRLTSVVVDETGEIASHYGISGSPTAVVVDAAQKIRAYGQPTNSEDIKKLFSRTFVPELNENAIILERQAAIQQG